MALTGWGLVRLGNYGSNSEIGVKLVLVLTFQGCAMLHGSVIILHIVILAFMRA